MRMLDTKPVKSIELNIKGNCHKRLVTMPILETYNPLKPYGKNLAVDYLNLFIERKHVIRLVDTNGSGKTRWQR